MGLREVAERVARTAPQYPEDRNYLMIIVLACWTTLWTDFPVDYSVAIWSMFLETQHILA